MQLKLPLVLQFLDVGYHPFADTRNLQQLLRFIHKGRDLLWPAFDGLSGTAVGTDAERVTPIDLQEIRDFVKDVGDRLVIQERYPSGIVTRPSRHKRAARGITSLIA